MYPFASTNFGMSPFLSQIHPSWPRYGMGVPRTGSKRPPRGDGSRHTWLLWHAEKTTSHYELLCTQADIFSRAFSVKRYICVVLHHCTLRCIYRKAVTERRINPISASLSQGTAVSQRMYCCFRRCCSTKNRMVTRVVPFLN